MRRLLEEYGKDPRISLVQAAVTERSIPWQMSTMQMTDDCLSTSDKEMFERWKTEKAFLGLISVPAITWEQLVNQFKHFDFVNIDAEGCSADLFLRMLDIGIYPLCCCVESDGQRDQLHTKAWEHGYSTIYFNECNMVFQRSAA
jgi:hypothetical protein